METYIFQAICTNVVDGDTIDCTMDLGFGLSTRQRFRLWGINCPETRTKDLEEKERGYLAKEFTADLIEGKSIRVQTYKSDSFGRYLAKVFIEISPDVYHCLNDLLLENGLAVPYMENTDLLAI